MQHKELYPEFPVQLILMVFMDMDEEAINLVSIPQSYFGFLETVTPTATIGLP